MARRHLSPQSTAKLTILLVFFFVFGVVFVNQNPDFASIAFPPIPAEHYQHIDEAVTYCHLGKDMRGFIAALAYAESTFRPDAVSSANAYGVTQALAGTWQFVGNTYQIGNIRRETFNDARLGYLVGACYLDYGRKTVTGRDDLNDLKDEKVLRGMLIGYNAGYARGKSYLSGNYNGPTSSLGYAEKIMRARSVYNLDFAHWDQEKATSTGRPLDVRNLIWNFLNADSSK